MPGIDRTAKLREVFLACDDDGNGYLSLPEYKKMAELDGLLSDLLVGSMQEWIFKEIDGAG